VSGCNTVVHSGVVGMVRVTREPSNNGVVVMGTVRRKTRATKAVGDELQAPKRKDFTKSESNASLVVTTGDDGGFQ
jgi:hypothetical protein